MSADRLRWPTMKRFALLMLIVALFAPRLAWGAHISDHSPLTSETAVHVHHNDHFHVAAADGHRDHGSQQEGSDDASGPGHHHPPSVVLAFAGLLPPGTLLPVRPSERDLASTVVRDGILLTRHELLDPPPRTA